MSRTIRIADSNAGECYLAVELHDDGTAHIYGWSDGNDHFTGIDLTAGGCDRLRAILGPDVRLQRQVDHFNRTHGDCGAELFDLREENAELRTRIQELTGGAE